MHSILSYKDVKSNLYQIDFNKLLANISHQDFINLFEHIFIQNIAHILSAMTQKEACIFSPELLTVALDDSVFKPWLPNLLGTNEYDGSAYSGQYNRIGYGYKQLLYLIRIT